MTEVVDLESTTQTQITGVKSEIVQELLEESTVCRDQLLEASLQCIISLISILEPLEES